MTIQDLTIKETYITLTQALKELGYISTGGQAKWYLQEFPVKLNDEFENRRGKKLYPGDIVNINGDLVRIKN
ncbi:S4 domain-containing protein YaaA [Holzapfeliella sp. He02]|uniref:S4 domain-containing protein YaaA n=1 Tax=Holzapfeliella saturejae TaxID=3082953 RepID=A0ABU8SEL2_9LACO